MKVFEMEKTIKCYAVKNGRNPGIYTSWAECAKQVKGYSGALYKSSATYAEAEAYICGDIACKSADRQQNVSQNGKHYNIYVDGSFDARTFRYSWAFAVYEDDSFAIHQANGIGKDINAASTRNVAGELQATVEAVIWAKTQNADSITIHHDYIGISEWATGRWKANNDTTKGYVQFIRQHLHWVMFKKVDAHTGVEGNELVDKLAKEALGEGLEPILDVANPRKYNKRKLK
jgi:ribonuclease HI